MVGLTRLETGHPPGPTNRLSDWEPRGEGGSCIPSTGAILKVA